MDRFPHSYLLQNDGTGKFTDVTEKNAKELSKVGMVTRQYGLILIKTTIRTWLYVVNGVALMHLLIVMEILLKKHLRKIKDGGILYCRLM